MNTEFREAFPILSRQVNGTNCVFLDGPAGTQVPDQVVQAMTDYYHTSNSNTQGTFITTKETDVLIDGTRSAVADLLGAAGSHTISFGQNMTTLNYSLARAIGRYLQKGDEILITQLDHEANRGPWLSLREQGIVVREVKITRYGLLDYDDLKDKINPKTRLLAMGWAANINGVINDVYLARKLTHEVGAWLLLDAVHFAPHHLIDVNAVGCDFLICSAYKFYGPHVGLLYARTGLLDRLPTDRLRTAKQHAPYSIETGTLNHAALAGVKAAIEFIAQQGNGEDQRTSIQNAFHHISSHEHQLGEKLYHGISGMNQYEICGPGFHEDELRAPTISFTHRHKPAIEVCEQLADHQIFAWAGHFYAIRTLEVLGLLEMGGVTRMGISAYTTSDEIDQTLDALSSI